MKKNYVSPNLEVIRIKQGNVVMNSHGGLECAGEDIEGGSSCHDCDWYCDESGT